MVRILICLSVLLLCVVPVSAERRVALVIGNSAYTKVAPLRNPQNDANAIAISLENLRFEVVRGINLDRRGFVAKIREFAKLSAGADVALFFYAGHGLQVGGTNYLAPIDATIADETDLGFEAIELSSILRVMEREDRINLIFLDACRDNPMSRSLSRSMGTRSAAVGAGLAPIDSGSGTLIGFATQPGNVALDGEGTVNSPFTTALLKHIDTPDLDVAQLMRRVRKDVKSVTNGRQIPWTNESLTEDFAFNSRSTERANVVKPVIVGNNGSTRSDAAQLELEIWRSARESKDPDFLRLYLDKYPGGAFASMARLFIKKYEASKQNTRKTEIAVVQPKVLVITPTRQYDNRSIARDFMLGHLESWSLSNSRLLARLPALYAARVKYYGKSRSRSQVLRDKRGFFDRWPDRNYRPRRHTLVVACEANRCRVSGLVDWSAYSSRRNASSTGLAKFVYDLNITDGRVSIFGETGSVIKRK